jgi:hypothetical protein
MVFGTAILATSGMRWALGKGRRVPAETSVSFYMTIWRNTIVCFSWLPIYEKLSSKNSSDKSQIMAKAP